MILSNEHRQEITSQNQNASGNLRLFQIYLTYHSNNLISMSLGLSSQLFITSREFYLDMKHKMLHNNNKKRKRERNKNEI